jgi:hypothetical protein
VAADVFVDLTRKAFVATDRGGDVSSPYGEVFHQDILDLSIQPIDYNPGGISSSNQYETLDASGYSISLLVTNAATGATLAGPFTSWTPNGTALRGSASLNTVAMDAAFTALDAGETLATIFWLQITNGSTRKVTVQTEVEIVKSAITSGTPSELPVTSYPTWEEALATFVRFGLNPNGSTATFPSPSGTYKTIIGTNDDGSGGASIET